MTSHPLVEGIVTQHIVLEGVDMVDYYDCPTCYEGVVDMTVWDGNSFATALEDRIFGPGRHAQDLLRDNPYLTRMYTIISPHEMTEDPMFHVNPDLEDVQSQRFATQRFLCSGDSLWTLPDDRQVFVPAGRSWPQIEGLPWVEEVQETPSAGPAMALVNNTELINERLAEYNAAFTDDDGDTFRGESGGSDSAGQDGSGSGCGCTVDNSGEGALVGFFGLLGLIGLRRRRN